MKQLRRCKYYFLLSLAAIVLCCPSFSQNRAAWLREAKFGVMTHYLPDWLAKTENKQIDVAGWNKMIDDFNVEGLAEQVKSAGAAYMIFTIGQNSGYYVSPNKTYDKIVGISPSKCAKRDLIADLSTALHKRGLKLIVYLPSGAPNGDSIAKKNLEWRNGPYPNKEFQVKWEQIIREWSIRWSDKIDGWWFDGCYWPNIMYRQEEAPGFKSFADAARAGNPKSIVAFNPGVFYRIMSSSPYEDYTAGEINKTEQTVFNKTYDGKLDGAQLQVLSFLGEKWGMGAPRYKDEEVLAFTQKLLNEKGAMTWDAPIQSSGLIYEPFIRQLTAVGKMIIDYPVKK